jgi:hypothetical protein
MLKIIQHRSVIAIFILLLTTTIAYAQDELAATLEVLSPGVEVRRVNTVNWIPVNIEAIVGVGDVIRTDATGRARVTFFADGTDTEILPDTEYRINQFEGNADEFQISVEILIGQTLQRLSRLLDANSRYEVTTPGMSLGARGTAFAIRVEDGGRSAMLVSDGNVAAEKDGTAAAEVPLGFGIRAEAAGALSDVVRATTFAELDAALDGCTANLSTLDDVSLNVRLGANTEFARAGVIAASEIDRLVGVTESGEWYRIAFRDGFGWILSTTAEIQEPCAGLRVFPDNYGPEDVARYSSLGDVVELEDLTGAPVLPESP